MFHFLILLWMEQDFATDQWEFMENVSFGAFGLVQLFDHC